MKVLLVCHRYAPFPGGTEIYVQNIAEEMLRRGHDITVLAETHNWTALAAGYYQGVRITNDHQVLISEKYDLIVVHGGDVSSQNVVHQYAQHIPSPVLYLLVKPSESNICLYGLQRHRFLGVSTKEDWVHVRKFGAENKARRVRHGIKLEGSIGQKSFKGMIKDNRGVLVPLKTFVSVGGFASNKAFPELVEAFTEVFKDRPDYQLHLYGYWQEHLAPPETNHVRCFLDCPRSEVINAIANADLYIMNSYEEGFGLVLLEAMVNRTPWVARNIAGAKVLAGYGGVYESVVELKAMMRDWENQDLSDIINRAEKYALENHLIGSTVDDIEKVLEEVK